MRDQILQDKCKTCNGSGYKLYGTTATWHGGIGGTAMTWGICNTCWGSGDSTKPWEDLRRLKAERMAYATAIRKLTSQVEKLSKQISK